MGEAVVLDASAVLAFLEDEPGAEEVGALLRGGEVWMTLVNLGEVVYIIERERGVAAADAVFADLIAPARPDGSPPIQWMPLDARLVRKAASLKARGGMSFADTFAMAAAALLECAVVASDPEFRAAETAGISVRWIPKSPAR
jgi:PIN domain nuclease of toxin-antitoxin system